MKTIDFYCNNCERKRAINVTSITPFYIIGACSICKNKTTINAIKLKKLKDAKSKLVLNYH